MEKTIRERIFELEDEEYRKFSSTLLPNINNIIGVRLPELRKLARNIAKDDWRNFLLNAGFEYFEEIMLQAMVIGYAKADAEEKLKYIAVFIPRIDNWSVCDSFCTGLKFAESNRELVWDFLQPYFHSVNEYEVRFGLVMVLNYFVQADYIEKILIILNEVKHEGYYAKMAVAWAVSICYTKFPEQTGRFLENNMLDDFTYNKALQKIVESYRSDKETKILMHSMKRKT